MITLMEYGCTAIVCLISAIVIQRIYKKEKRNSARADEVKGILWFGWAIFIWGLGALLNFIAVYGFEWSSSNKLLVYLGVGISLLNSMFILLSLPSIEHKGTKGMVIRLVERFSEKEFSTIYLVVMSMLVFVFFAASYTNAVIDNSFIWLIDIPISILVAFALLNALNKAFNNRNMRFMYLPSFMLFMLIVIAVSHRIVPKGMIPFFMTEISWNILGTITAVSFKFLFILLFSILLYSWKFLSEKEEKQNRLDEILLEKAQIEKRYAKLNLANESHLDTIARLKEEIDGLKKANRIELSERQKEVLGNLALVGHKRSYTEMADAMHISADGFQTHIHQIKKVLNISGSAGKNLLIQYALENDMLKYATLKEE